MCLGIRRFLSLLYQISSVIQSFLSFRATVPREVCPDTWLLFWCAIGCWLRRSGFAWPVVALPLLPVMNTDQRPIQNLVQLCITVWPMVPVSVSSSSHSRIVHCCQLNPRLVMSRWGGSSSHHACTKPVAILVADPSFHVRSVDHVAADYDAKYPKEAENCCQDDLGVFFIYILCCTKAEAILT